MTARARFTCYSPNAASRTQLGDLVEVEGDTASTRSSVFVDATAVRVTGHAPLPPGEPFSVDTIITDRPDIRWAEVTATVRTAVAAGRWLRLTIGSTAAPLRVEVLGGADGDADRLVDTRVRIRGVVSSDWNARRQWAGAILLVPDPNQITVVDPAPPDPWARPTRPVDTLTGVVAGPYESRRVHIRGVVTYHAHDGRLWIADDTGGVEVRVADVAKPLPAGTEVDVLGFPVAGSYGVALADARYRVTGRTTLPPAVPISTAQALAGPYDAELVQLEGRAAEPVESTGRRGADARGRQGDVPCDCAGRRATQRDSRGQPRAAYRHLLGGGRSRPHDLGLQPSLAWSGRRASC